MSSDPDSLSVCTSGVALEPSGPMEEPVSKRRLKRTPLPLDLLIGNPSQMQSTNRPSIMKRLDAVPMSSHRVAPQFQPGQRSSLVPHYKLKLSPALLDAAQSCANETEDDLKQSHRQLMITSNLFSLERIPILVVRLNNAMIDRRPPIDDDEQRFGSVDVGEMSDSTKQDYEQCPKMTVALSTMDVDCHICSKAIVQVAVMKPCHHAFCTVCALEWFKHCSKCPDCRRRIKSVALNIVDMSTYDSFPESYPNEIETFASRNLKSTMLQFFAMHYEQFPELGYPPRKLDLHHLNSITECVMSDLTYRLRLFRCLVYMHKYDFVEEFPITRDHSMMHFKENPASVQRLFVFIQKEFESFEVLLPIISPSNKYSEVLKRILTKYPMGSIECQEQFVNKFQRYGHLPCNEQGDVILYKMFHEMHMYAKSPIDEYEEYFETVTYQTNEVMRLRHFGRNVKRPQIENQLLAENEIRIEPTSGRTESLVGLQTCENNGTSGDRGAIETHGTCGISGAIEAPGTCGIRGAIEAPGTCGISGAIEAPGTSGIRGAIEAPGTSGIRGAIEALGTSGIRGAIEAPGPCGISGAIEAPGTNGTISTSPISNNRTEVSAEGDVEFICEFDNPKKRNTPKPKLNIVPQVPLVLEWTFPESPQPTSEAFKRPHEPVSPSRVVRRRNTMDGRDGAAPSWKSLLPPRSRINHVPAPLSAEAILQRLLRRKEEMRIRRSGYSLKKIRDMRRTIRYSAKSPFYYRTLMSEVKRWFAGMDTALNAHNFAHRLKPYFTDMARAYEYFQLNPKPAMKCENMTGTILQERIEQFKEEAAFFKSLYRLDVPNETKYESDRHREASTPSDDGTMQSTAQLEGGSGDQVDPDLDDDATIKDKQISTKDCIEQINKTMKSICYKNYYVYSSDSDYS